MNVKKLAPWILAAVMLMPAAAPTFAASGKDLYMKHCNACHKNISNKSFKHQSVSKLTKAVISGAGGKMKPRGGSHLSDSEIKAAVKYLISK